MPRPLAILTIVLTLLSGVLLGQFGTFGRQETFIPVRPSANAIAEVQAFYGEVNSFLADGDATQLAPYFHAAFVDHAPYLDSTGTVHDYLDYLRSLRRIFQGFDWTPSSCQRIAMSWWSMCGQRETIAVNSRVLS